MKGALTLSSILYCLFLTFPFSVQAQSPVSYSSPSTIVEVEALVEQEFTANTDFNIVNVKFTGQVGNSATAGTFDNALQPFGFKNGIVLANAPIDQFFGGNTITSAGSDIGQQGDANLSLFNQVYNGGQPLSTSDATILEIDFIPSKTSLSLTYLFASEEYCDFVGSVFTDQMGLFLSGPGIQGPFNSNGISSINIAEVPDEVTGQPIHVGINNIHDAKNAQFYVDNNTVATASNPNGTCTFSNPANNPFTSLSQFDGWTVPLEAVYDNLQTGEIYKLRIVVADGSDAIFGSAIFLQANSFDAGVPFPPVVADAGPDQTLTCVEFAVTLGAANPDPNSNYEWTGPNGYTAIIPNPQVVEPGEYILTVTNLVTLEVTTDEVIVTLDIELPVIDIDFTTNILTCENPTVLLTAAIEDPTINALYEWSGPSIFNSTEAEFEVNEAGQYLLVVTNVSNGCINEIDAEVLQNFQNTITDIDFGTFSSFPIQIDADSYITNSTANYSWQASEGLQVIDFPIASISQPGEYTFLEDFGNPSCVNSFIFEVLGSTLIADAGPDQLLTCIIPMVTLGSTGNPTGPDFSYTWTESGQNVVGTEPFFDVSAEGVYTLTITNNITGESSSDTAVVELDESLPIVVTSVQQVLDCQNTIVLLEASTTASNASYLWVTSNGNIVSSPNQQNINVDQGGEYILTVTDNDNGCSAQVIEVVDSNQEEELTINVPFITSSEPSVELDALSFLDPNSSYSFQWTNSNSEFISINPIIVVEQSDVYTCLALNVSSGCTTTLIFTVNFSQNLIADAGPDQTLTCVETVVTLGGTNAGTNLTYEWSGPNGFIAFAPNPQANEPGVYILTLTDLGTSEVAIDEVIVFADTNLPQVSTTESDILTCLQNIVQIFGSTPSPNVSFLWTTSNGNIVTDPTQASINVDQGGEYTFTVTDNNNGCANQSTTFVGSNQTEEKTINVPTITSSMPDVLLTGIDFVDEANDGPHDFVWSDQNGPFDDLPAIMVEESGIYTLTATNIHGCVTVVIFTVNFTQNLVADAGPDQSLTCVRDVVVLGSPNTSSGPNITFQWTDEFGQIFSNSINPAVFTTGQYQLNVTNTSTGETAVDVVFVFEDREEPQIIIAPAPTITCFAPTVNLIATSSNVPAGLAVYMWQGDSDAILTDPNQASITVGASGGYQVILTNSLNGCSSAQSVFVNEDIAGQTQTVPTITSTTPTFTIDPSDFMQNTNCSFAWTMQAGLTVINFPLAEISQAGTYTFVKTNDQTGCTTTFIYTVQFTSNTTADAGPDQTIDCTTSSVVLGSSNTSVGPDFTYSWTNDSSNLVGTTPFIEVNEVGTYTLTVFNTQNNTFDSDEVFVLSDVVLISLNIPTPDVLDCANQVVSITGFSSQTNVLFQWSSFDGNILSVSNQANVVVDQPGVYTLEVTDVVSGCSETQTVQVTQNIDGGSFDVAPIQSSVYPITITADDFPAGFNFDFTWTPAQGLTVTGTTTADIAQPGQYTFVATNTATGCDYIYIYTVYDNLLADAGSSQSLTCVTSSVTLGGPDSSVGFDIDYTWSNASGTQIANSSNVSVNESGLYTLQVTNITTGETFQDQVLVTENFDEPLFVIRSPAAITFAEPITFIDARLFSPDAVNAGFLWSGFGGNIVSDPLAEDIEVDKSGIYELTVTNTLNGCLSTSAIEVVQNFDSETIPLENIVVSTFPVQLDASAQIADTTGIVHHPYPDVRSSNFEFKWVERSSLQVTDFPIAQVFQEGIYAFLKLNISTGFVTRYEYDVKLTSASVVADAGPDIMLTCETSTIEICLGGGNSSEGPEFTYEWTDANGTVVSTERIFKPLDFQTNGFSYTLLVTNTTTGEQASDSVMTVESRDLPSISIASSLVLTCVETETIIDLTIDSPAASEVSIQWEGPGIITDPTAEDITVDQPGVYTVSVQKLDNGCVISSTILIEQDVDPIQVLVEPSSELTCDTFMILDPTSIFDQLNVDTCIGSWQMQEGLMIDTFPVAIITQSGTYIFNKIDPVNGCIGEIIYNVTIPDEVIADAGSDTSIVCNSIFIGGDSTSINGNFTYTWNTNDGCIVELFDTEAIVDCAGTYELVVTDIDSGCTASDEVVVAAANLLTISADITDVSCNGGDDGILTVVVASVGIPSDTISVSMNDNLIAGDYETTATDANGCTIIKTFTISEPAALTVEFIINADNQLEALVTGGVGGYSYDWNVEADSNMVSNLINGTEYELTVTDTNGCELTDTFLFVIDAVFSPSAKEISVFPNPTDGLLHLQLDAQVNLDAIQIRLFDIQGILMNLDKRSISKSKIALDLSHLQEGAYILQATIDGELYYQKVVVF